LEVAVFDAQALLGTGMPGTDVVEEAFAGKSAICRYRQVRTAFPGPGEACYPLLFPLTFYFYFGGAYVS